MGMRFKRQVRTGRRGGVSFHPRCDRLEGRELLSLGGHAHTAHHRPHHGSAQVHALWNPLEDMA